ncbi:MAG: histidine phosphatase family protein [Aulosira sp. ZfuVER01]|nr:histidine phosphatase family protein [Aulosira sp. ZfuVER01]MDZ7999341.1 histidine phosphatase family protein [Aulosira sp. DedVER01a]MDZ8051878.1 histidine phosphatase family protein [Aulosira sp. ZfuCHP01]
MIRRYIIFGLGTIALLLMLKPLYKPKTQEKQTATTITQPQQSVDSTQESSVSPSTTNVSGNSEAKIWFRLRQGRGYVVIMRHALAPGIGDPPDFKLNDCSTQRNLSDEGRKQAIRIGKAFKTQKIPVSRVLSSQWCRCLETAKLLNLGKVESFPTINSFFSNYKTQSQQTAKLRQFILNNRNTPGVIVMITHEINITTLTSDIYPKSGDSVVLRANEQNKIEVVGQIKAI